MPPARHPSDLPADLPADLLADLPADLRPSAQRSAALCTGGGGGTPSTRLRSPSRCRSGGVRRRDGQINQLRCRSMGVCGRRRQEEEQAASSPKPTASSQQQAADCIRRRRWEGRRGWPDRVRSAGGREAERRPVGERSIGQETRGDQSGETPESKWITKLTRSDEDRIVRIFRIVRIVRREREER